MDKTRTIFEALAVKLGRNPTNAEANAEVRRILKEAFVPDFSENLRLYGHKEKQK